MSKAPTQKKRKKSVPLGIAHLQATFNNTIVTFTDAQGNAITASSAGKEGFKGTKKSTPYAAQVAVEAASKEAKECGMQTISIQIKGAGSQREAALRALLNQQFVVTQIADVSALPHNGVRPPKRRKV
jgi:small subunit ribosomal protein S11